MKQLYPLLLLLIVFAAGCSSGATPVAPNPDPGGGSRTWYGLTAKVDMEAWSADNVSLSTASGFMTVTATAGGSSINFTFASTSSPKTFQFNPTGASGAYSNGINVYLTDGNANAGTLTITAVDANHIAGSFSFTAADMQGGQLVTVTGGKFSIER